MKHQNTGLALLLAVGLPLAVLAATTSGGIGNSNSLITAALKSIEAQSPEVARVSSDRIAHAAINGILREIDPSGNSFSYGARDAKPAAGLPSPAIVVRLVEGVPTILSVFPNTDAFYKELSPGDVLLKVGDTTVVGRSMPEIDALLRGEPGSTLKLTAYRKAGRKFLEPVVKREVVTSAAYGRNVGRSIAWLQVNVLDTKGVEQLKARLDEMLKIKPMGLVLDLRSTSGGTVDDAVAAASLFVSGVSVVRIQSRSGAPAEKVAAKTSPATMPMVIICDLGTSGAAEVLAAALQDDKRAVVVGEKTGGVASAQTILNLDPQNLIQLTTEVYLSPSGREIWAEGVKPDIAMKVDQSPSDQFSKFRQEFTRFSRGEKPAPKGKDASSASSTAPATGSASSTSATTATTTTAESEEEKTEDEEEPGPDGKPRLKTSDGILEEYKLVKQHDTMLVRAINILISANIFFEYGQRQK